MDWKENYNVKVFFDLIIEKAIKLKQENKGDCSNERNN